MEPIVTNIHDLSWFSSSCFYVRTSCRNVHRFVAIQNHYVKTVDWQDVLKVPCNISSTTLITTLVTHSLQRVVHQEPTSTGFTDQSHADNLTHATDERGPAIPRAILSPLLVLHSGNPRHECSRAIYRRVVRERRGLLPATVVVRRGRGQRRRRRRRRRRRHERVDDDDDRAALVTTRTYYSALNERQRGEARSGTRVIEENIRRRRRRYHRSQRCILIFPPVDETRRSG